MRWKASRRTKLVVCFAIVYLVWGSSYLATSVGVHNLPPRLFAGTRFLIAGVLLLSLALALGRNLRLDRADLRNVIVVGIFSVVIANGVSNWAMQWVNSGTAALLNVSTAFWIALLGAFGARAHALEPRAALGIGLGIVGVALIVWPEEGLNDALIVPQLAILAGCAGWAVATIYYRNVRTRLDVLAFTGWNMLFGGAMLLGVGLAFGDASRWTYSPQGLAAMAYLIVFSSCLTYTAYGWLTHHTTPAQIGTYSYVNPAIATLLGWWLLDERLTRAQLLGMVVILAGVVLVSWAPGVGLRATGQGREDATGSGSESSASRP
jgi:drug/metabolite transporter (DMT)-like permease